MLLFSLLFTNNEVELVLYSFFVPKILPNEFLFSSLVFPNIPLELFLELPNNE